MISLIILLIRAQISHAEKCLALSLEGGGSHGAYEIGALTQLAQNLTDAEIAYDVLAGISIGAFNSGGLAQFGKDETKEAIQFMLDIWNNFTSTADVMVDWPGGIPYALFFKPSLYDPAPYRELVN